MNDKNIYFLSGWASGNEFWSNIVSDLNIGISDDNILPWWSYLEDEAIAGFVPPEDTILCGWSLGGLIALKLAIRHPSQIKALILISSCARMCKCGDYPGVNPDVLTSMLKGIKNDKETTLAYFSKLCFIPERVSGKKDAFLEESKKLDSMDLEKGLRFLLYSDVRNDLADIKVPVLLLHGERDQVIPVSTSHYLNKHLSHSQLKTFESKGHGMVSADSEDLSFRIRSFLNEI